MPSSGLMQVHAEPERRARDRKALIRHMGAPGLEAMRGWVGRRQP